MKKLYLLLILGLVCSIPSIMAAQVNVQGTLPTSYGTISWHALGGEQTAAFQQDSQTGASASHVYLTGLNAVGSTFFPNFNAWIAARTNTGNYAASGMNVLGLSDLTNFNLYGYLAPNVAWTGLYVDQVRGANIQFLGWSGSNDAINNLNPAFNQYNTPADAALVPFTDGLGQTKPVAAPGYQWSANNWVSGPSLDSGAYSAESIYDKPGRKWIL